ncbi:MAG: hypothetical protein IANPNBLG_04390 [Bryobacteraceae bacterium]|nr:hypothetical protein [Bryobacteraceae bacterium]
MRLRHVLLALLTAGLPQPAAAQIRTNPGFYEKSIPRNDDGSAPLESLGWTLNFFGRLRTAVFVNNNGNLTFDAPLPTYTPFGLNGVNREIIAPFFADVDTRGPGSNLVTYGRDTINKQKAFAANYVNVGYYASHDDKLNRFQVVLIERPDTGDGNFDIEFNYERILWETGDASGGVNGFGNVSASAGWSNGSGQPGTSYQIPGSLVPGAFLDNGPNSLAYGHTPGSSTAVRNGRWVYRARGGTVIPALSITTGCPIPNASAGRAYSFQFAAIGSKPPYRWSVTADPDAALPSLTMSGAGNLSGTPPSPGQYAFTVNVSATDEDGDVTVSRRCMLTVDPPAISITTNTALPSTGAGMRYTARLDAEGSTNPIRFDFHRSYGVPGLALNPNGTLSGIPGIPGNYQFQVIASSEGADRAIPAVKRFQLTVVPSELGVRGLCPLPRGTGGVPYEYKFSARGGFPPYRWSAIGGLPTGLSLTEEGRLNGIPQVPNWWPFTVQVDDSRGNTAQLACGVPIEFPEISITNACPLPAATAGHNYSQKLSAEGGKGPYAWSVSGSLPAGLRLSQDGTLSGVALAGGNRQFRLRVNDRQGHAAAIPCSLSVLQPERGITSCPLPNAYAGEPYSQRMFASGGNEPYYWNTTSPLPAGLRLSPDGFLSGTLDKAGSYRVSLRATDVTGVYVTRSCELSVAPQTLRLTSGCPLPAAAMGVEYSFRLSAAGGAEPYTFSLRGDPPRGIRLLPNGVFAGKPGEAGVFPVELTVRDRRGQTSSLLCALVVDLPDLPEIKITGLPETLQPASAGPSFAIELGSAYPLALSGEATLAVAPNTENATAEVNRADPAVHFSNGQMTMPFTIAAGTRSVPLQLSATGTVASTITVSASRFQAAGVDFTRQAAAVTRVNRSVPVLTNVCYAPNEGGFDLDVSGYSTTRDLTTGEVTFGSNTYKVDLKGSSNEYFSSDISVRTGGTFRIRAPYRLTQGNAQNLGQGTAIIRNSAGPSASRSIQKCQ